MKLSTLSLLTLLALRASPTTAWPGMGGAGAGANSGSTLHHLLHPRAEKDDDHSDPPMLIGDLLPEAGGPRTPVGKLIARILLGDAEPESNAGVNNYTPPGPLKSKACKADTCCVWSYISDTLTNAFKGPSGRCNDNARAAIRLGFHDAGTWSMKLKAKGKDFGGADGSIVLSGVEILRPENRGLEDIVIKTKAWADKFNVGVADLIQFMAVHAVVTCPLGPRFRVFVGRKDSSRPAPDGLLPGVDQPAGELVKLFKDKTISPHELAALVGAHSTSRQFFVDPARAGAPQDDTPGVWDTAFYRQTIGDAPKKVFRFQSDVVLAKHPKVKEEWDQFAGDEGQEHWNEDYARAYIRLSLLGVNNINDLTECTKVLPKARKTFKGAGEGGITE